MKKHLLAFLLLLSIVLSSSAFAYGTGYSAFPLTQKSKVISSELTSDFSGDGGGVGLQLRFTQKFFPKFIAEVGAGLSGADNSETRAFVATDYEIFPDYMNQPRFSVKTTFGTGKEQGLSRTRLLAAPNVSKGFNFWGYEAYPFVSLPVGLNLHGDTNTFKTEVSTNLGITGNLPFEGFDHLASNIELQVGLKNSFTGLLVGLSYPF
jgi:hypothetical protein